MIDCRGETTIASQKAEDKWFYSKQLKKYGKLTKKQIRQSTEITPTTSLRNGCEMNCRKCGWKILYNEKCIHTRNRWSGEYNFYHPWCTKGGMNLTDENEYPWRTW